MFRIEFKTDNAAFDDGNRAQEIARILRDEIAFQVRHGALGGIVRDINGNRVGQWSITAG